MPKFIGFDATEHHRTRGSGTYDPRGDGYDISYPLREWGWDRARCEEEIADASLPIPVKSACFCCPASKRWEIDHLEDDHPQLYQIAITMENGYRNGKHWRGSASSTKGLGRKFTWDGRENQRRLFA